MIPAAPVDFWQRVIDKVARMVFEHETRPGILPGSYVNHRGEITVVPTVGKEPKAEKEAS